MYVLQRLSPFFRIDFKQYLKAQQKLHQSGSEQQFALFLEIEFSERSEAGDQLFFRCQDQQYINALLQQPFSLPQLRKDGGLDWSKGVFVFQQSQRKHEKDFYSEVQRLTKAPKSDSEIQSLSLTSSQIYKFPIASQEVPVMLDIVVQLFDLNVPLPNILVSPLQVGYFQNNYHKFFQIRVASEDLDHLKKVTYFILEDNYFSLSSLIQLEKDFQSINNQPFIQKRTLNFSNSLQIPLKKAVEVIQSNSCFVSDKADGYRVALFIDEKENVFMINQQKTIQVLRKNSSELSDIAAIFDCEFVLSFDKQFLIKIFDVIYSSTATLSSFEEKMGFINKFVKEYGEKKDGGIKIGVFEGINLHMDTIDANKILDNLETIGSREHEYPTDGIIVQTYKGNQQNFFKIKGDKSSIDLFVHYKKNKLGQFIKKIKKNSRLFPIELYAFNKTTRKLQFLVEYDFPGVGEGIPQCTDRMTIIDGSVIEFLITNNKELIPSRIRFDKSSLSKPNEISNILTILQQPSFPLNKQIKNLRNQYQYNQLIFSGEGTISDMNSLVRNFMKKIQAQNKDYVPSVFFGKHYYNMVKYNMRKWKEELADFDLYAQGLIEQEKGVNVTEEVQWPGNGLSLVFFVGITEEEQERLETGGKGKRMGVVIGGDELFNYGLLRLLKRHQTRRVLDEFDESYRNKLLSNISEHKKKILESVLYYSF